MAPIRDDGPDGADLLKCIAGNSVYHDAQHPSRIILPIVPAAGTSQAARRE
jgi:hypothetical protein